MDAAAARALLARIVGTWHGEGHLEYPTIDDARYREVLDIRALGAAGPLHYLQQTWKATPAGEAPSHVETGFITVEDDGSVLILNAQGPDRVEVLRGRIEEHSPGTWSLDAAAEVHGGDPRMVSASRSIRVRGDRISYSMAMATDRVPETTLHLRATLSRMES